MKKIMLLVVAVLFTAQAYAWRCDITTYDDISSVDQCFLRIMEHYVHSAKVELVKDWQKARTQNNGTLKKAGALWLTPNFNERMEKFKRIRDTKDWLVRDGIYQLREDVTLSCDDDDE